MHHNTHYRFNDRFVAPGDPDWQAVLSQAHRDKARLYCLCREPSVAMYVAHVESGFLLKRMPNSGNEHSPHCESYEMPQELSGLSDVMGGAIREEQDTGKTTVKLGFSLTRVAGRKPPTGKGSEQSSVKADSSKLTLRGLLHYLWESARLNHWSPAMEGKRNWFVLRKYLLQAAADLSTKGHALTDSLYIPESFRHEHKDEIEKRRKTLLAPLHQQGGSARQLMVVIAPLKEFARTATGHLVTLKHLPDFRFLVSDDLFQRFGKRFENELAMLDQIKDSQLILIGTFGLSAVGVPTLEEIAVMNITANAIPFENLYEFQLIEALVSGHRRFIRGLRYNRPSSKPVATALLTDTDPTTALYVDTGAHTEYSVALDEITNLSQFKSWRWNVIGNAMPALPPNPSVAPTPPTTTQGNPKTCSPTAA